MNNRNLCNETKYTFLLFELTSIVESVNQVGHETMYASSGLKSSRNKKNLNDVTAAPFSVSFSQLTAAKKTPKTGQL